MKRKRKGGKLNTMYVLKAFLPLLIFLAVTLSVTFCLGNSGIYEGVEGEFASICRKMADSSDWLTPKINGFKAFSERPAAYWLGALSIKMFGTSELAFRFPLAIAAGFTALCVFLIARLFFGTLTAILSVMVLCTSLFFQFAFRIYTAEPFMLASELATIWIFFCYLNHLSKKYKALFWLTLAIAFVFKGSITFIPLIGLFAAAYYTEQRFSINELIKYWPGWLIFIVVGLGWHITVAMQNPTLGMYLIANEFNVTVLMNWAGQFSYPFYFYALLLPAMFFPWVGALFSGILEQIKEFKEAPTASYMVLWALTPFIFFTVCLMKNPGFILQCVAPLAIMTAECINRAFFDHEEDTVKESIKNSRWHCITIAGLTAICGMLLSYWGFLNFQSSELIGQAAIFGGIFWLFCALIIIAFILKGSRKGVLIIIASIVPGILLFVFPYVHGNEHWEGSKKLPSKFAFLKNIAKLPKAQDLLFVDDTLNSWYFYTGREISACGINTDDSVKKGWIKDDGDVYKNKIQELKNLKSDTLLIMRKASIPAAEEIIKKRLYTVGTSVQNEDDWAVLTIQSVSKIEE